MPATRIVGEIPGINHHQIDTLLKQVLVFLRENVNDLGDRELLLKVEFNSAKKEIQKMSSEAILEALKVGENILEIDHNFVIVGLDKLSVLSLSDISFFSQENNCCLFHVYNGVELVIYANGRTIIELNALAPATSPMAHKKYARSAHNYELALKDHYKNRIRFGGAFSDHWEDRKTRKLRSFPKKTEKMFHDNLQNYLDENLDGAVVYGNVKKITDDATDIEIRVYGQEVLYIIEVKWLGSNGATSYSETRLSDGISQVEQYLQRDPVVKEVCLVAYDARNLAQFNGLMSVDEMKDQWKEITECKGKSLPVRSKGYVFYLESKFASDKF